MLLSGSVIFSIHPICSTIIYSWTIIFLLLRINFAKEVKKLAKSLAETQSSVGGKNVDSLSNINNIHLFIHHDYEANILNIELDNLRKKDQKLRLNQFY